MAVTVKAAEVVTFKVATAVVARKLAVAFKFVADERATLKVAVAAKVVVALEKVVGIKVE